VKCSLQNQVLLLNNSKLGETLEIRDKNQRMMSQIKQYENSHDMIVIQIGYIKKWMDPIGKLEEHIQHVIQYCKLKKKFYASSDEMDRLRQLIKYDLDEDDDEIIVPKAVELIIKFKKENDKYLNALLSMNFEKMKQLQDDTTTDKIEEMMDNFVVEIANLQRDNAKRRAQESAVKQRSSTTALQSNSWSISLNQIYKFVSWFIRWLFL